MSRFLNFISEQPALDNPSLKVIYCNCGKEKAINIMKKYFNAKSFDSSYGFTAFIKNDIVFASWQQPYNKLSIEPAKALQANVIINSILLEKIEKLENVKLTWPSSIK